ncbi:MAG: hypothetical protein ABH811_01925 [archaeon]
MVINIPKKRAWIKIVEAFVAILLILSVVLIILNRGSLEKDSSDRIYNAESSILRGVQIDQNFREKIILIPEENLPVEWDEFESEGLEDIKNKIIFQTPSYLDCVVNICGENVPCVLDDSDKPKNKEIYAQQVGILYYQETFKPRQLKIFCWVN